MNSSIYFELRLFFVIEEPINIIAISSLGFKKIYKKININRYININKIKFNFYNTIFSIFLCAIYFAFSNNEELFSIFGFVTPIFNNSTNDS